MTTIYPTLIAPLFNKFEPLSDLDLKAKIEALASRVSRQSRMGCDVRWRAAQVNLSCSSFTPTLGGLPLDQVVRHRRLQAVGTFQCLLLRLLQEQAHCKCIEWLYLAVSGGGWILTWPALCINHACTRPGSLRHLVEAGTSWGPFSPRLRNGWV